jgi:hemolysin activation/secretion protein
VFLSGTVSAQPLQSQQSPAEDFNLPDLEPRDPEAEERVLPIVMPRAQANRLGGGSLVRVDSFAFKGNTVFTDSELTALIGDFANREITTAELQLARDALTVHYIQNGYVNSGATIPDQEVNDGVVTFLITEGRLTSVRAEGTRFFRSSYFEKRLMLGSDKPLRIQDLERRLQVFNTDWRIKRITTHVEPGERIGEAVMRLQIDEAPPVRGFAEWSNNTPSNLGEQTGRFGLGLTNLLGVGDEFSASIRETPGLTDSELNYGVPITPWDTEVRLRYRESSGEIVDGPLTAGGVKFTSNAWTAGVGLVQPLIRNRNTTLRVALLGEWRRSRTKIDGFGFGYPGTGSEEDSGITNIGVVRTAVDWLYRSRTQVFAIRQIVSVGVPAWDATENRSGVPDTNFVSSYTQLRMAVRIPQVWDLEIVTRGDLQLSNDPLIPLEQIGVGGIDTVRGYPDNEVVRDRAVIASIEMRAQIYRSPNGRQRLQIAPFVDFAYAWDHQRTVQIREERKLLREDRTLVSGGVGLRYRIGQLLRAEIYYGAGRNTDKSDSAVGVQQHGVHFRLRADLP